MGGSVPFFHGMQTAGTEEDINENTVASGRREKKEIKKERGKRERIIQSKFRF
jgi:hypothetical protein